MLQRTIEEYKDRIRTLFIEDQWLKGFNLAIKLYENLKQIDNSSKHDLYFCNIYLSVGARRLGDSKLGIAYGKNAIKYATTKGEEINSHNAIAICYIETKSVLDAIKEYDHCIKICNDWLEVLGEDYSKEKYITLECKADSIHNKGDALNDIPMIRESITIYKQLRIMNDDNKQSLNNKIAKAYKNINRIHRELFTPLTLAL